MTKERGGLRADCEESEERSLRGPKVRRCNQLVFTTKRTYTRSIRGNKTCLRGGNTRSIALGKDYKVIDIEDGSGRLFLLYIDHHPTTTMSDYSDPGSDYYDSDGSVADVRALSN